MPTACLVNGHAWWCQNMSSSQFKNNVPYSAGRCLLGLWGCKRAESECCQRRQTLQRNWHDAHSQRVTPGSGPSSSQKHISRKFYEEICTAVHKLEILSNKAYSNLQYISQKYMQLCVLTRKASNLLADFFQKTCKHFFHLWIDHDNL